MLENITKTRIFLFKAIDVTGIKRESEDKGEELKSSRAVVALILAFIVVSSSLTVNVSLADSAPAHGVISLTFDDAWQSQYDYAFPLMQDRGMVGTFYVVTSKLETNATGTDYLSFAELQTMQNYGCEIASHSVDHPDFTTLTDSQIIQECNDSKQVLQSYGLTVNNFAYPYGAYNDHTDSIVSQFYRSGRGVWCPDNVSQLPYTQWDVYADEGAPGDPGCLYSLESIVNQVYSTNEWAVLYFHFIFPDVNNSLNVINTQTFASLLDYIKSKGIPTLTINEALNLVSSPAPPLTVTISPTSAKIYTGQSITFSSSVSGGTPGFSYEWCLNGSTPGSTSDTWIFRPYYAGNYEVYLNVTDALGYQVQSNIVTDIEVNSLPSATISPASANMTFSTTQQFTSTSGYTNLEETIGDTTSYSGENNGAIDANALIPLTAGTTLTVGVNVKSPAGQISAAIYSDNNGEPGPLLGSSPSQTAVPGWNDLTISGINFQAGTILWVAFQTDNPNCIIYYSSNTAYSLFYSSQSYRTYPTSPQWLTWPNWVYNMRLTYNGTSPLGGFPPYTYQWYYTNGTAIPGATDSTLNYKANSTGVFNIYMNVTDSLNTVTQSNTATINVFTQPTASITPTSVNMTLGTTQQFTSTTTGGLKPYTYQWYQNDTTIPRATNNTWTFTPPATGHYKISFKITDALGYQVQFNNITNITVNPQATATINPTNVNMIKATTQTFNSTITGGTTPYTYQWYQNGTAISGANGANYSFTPTTTGSYSLYLNVTDSAGVTVSSNISTARDEAPVNVAITPAHVGMYVGQSQTFSSIVSGGTTPYSYQWILNDSAVSGANGATWVFSPSSTGHFIVYLNVTDGINLKTQSNIVADIVVYLPLTVSVSPGAMDLTVGGMQQFSSSVEGGVVPYIYQWYCANGTAMSGASTSSLTFTANQAGALGIYLNVTDNLNAKAQSNIITINVTPSPTPTPSPSPTFTPTQTPTPNPTATPTSTPSTSPTPKATPTSQFTPTPVPTSTPTSTTVSPKPESQSTVSFPAEQIAVAAIAIIVAVATIIMAIKKKSNQSLSPSAISK